MRTARILYWRWGGVLMAVGLSGLMISSHLWTRGGGYSLLGPLMIASLVPAAVGALFLGQALRSCCRGYGLKGQARILAHMGSMHIARYL